MRLTELKVRSAKPGRGRYKLADGGGLYVLVNPSSKRNPNGSKLWRLKYRHAGKEKLLALGAYPQVTLAEAREARDKAKRLLRVEYIDPGTRISRKARIRDAKALAASSFAAIAEAWYAENLADHWAPATADKVRLYLDLDLLPALGPRPIKEITRPEIVAALGQIKDRGARDVAKKCRGWLSNIFRKALDEGLIDINPATDLGGKKGKTPERRHHPHLPLSELPDFLKALDSYGGSPETRGALQMLLLTAVRPGELRGATWDEFDLGAATWSIPAERMKMRKRHVVPLPQQAIEILREAQKKASTREFVFPSAYKPREQMSDGTLNRALERLGYKGRQTGHGFRHLISTALNERGYNRDWIERQLAHGDSNEIRDVYNGAEYLDRRREMMQAWADELDAMRRGKVAARGIGKAA